MARSFGTGPTKLSGAVKTSQEGQAGSVSERLIYFLFSTLAKSAGPPQRLTGMVDAVGTTKYSYTAAGQLLTEDGPFNSDTVKGVIP